MRTQLRKTNSFWLAALVVLLAFGADAQAARLDAFGTTALVFPTVAGAQLAGLELQLEGITIVGSANFQLPQTRLEAISLDLEIDPQVFALPGLGGNAELTSALKGSMEFLQPFEFSATSEAELRVDGFTARQVSTLLVDLPWDLESKHKLTAVIEHDELRFDGRAEFSTAPFTFSRSSFAVKADVANRAAQVWGAPMTVDLDAGVDISLVPSLNWKSWVLASARWGQLDLRTLTRLDAIRTGAQYQSIDVEYALFSWHLNDGTIRRSLDGDLAASVRLAPSYGSELRLALDGMIGELGVQPSLSAQLDAQGPRRVGVLVTAEGEWKQSGQLLAPSLRFEGTAWDRDATQHPWSAVLRFQASSDPYGADPAEIPDSDGRVLGIAVELHLDSRGYSMKAEWGFSFRQMIAAWSKPTGT